MPFHARRLELSLSNKDKGLISLDELQRRLEQFKGIGHVLVTNSPTFLEKAGLFKAHHIFPVFHIGGDVAFRMARDHGWLGVAGINAHFIIYERVGESIETLVDLPNFIWIRSVPKKLWGVSSSNLRKASPTNLNENELRILNKDKISD
jgi:hypothetical protein